MFVRALSMEEGRKLQRISRVSKDPVRLRRAIVVLMSGQGQAARDITSLMQVSEDCMRDALHAFNERGFAALDPKWSGGSPRTIGEQICPIVRTSPADRVITVFTTWSLAKLQVHLLECGTVAAISRGPLNLLPRKGKTWQHQAKPKGCGRPITATTGSRRCSPP
ncbi:helix-turn-helix domain-containing protein [Allokutzneria albata]|uniref:helix-turn-helix domain-containing protein n=1 Tax=Allokutzneria albata TaxID=211114 RepID=UPI000B216D77|nr:helix-turn-helix domain-containing protein [Allokutzneria albata]